MEQMMGDMDIAFPHLGIYLQNVPKTIMVGNFGIAIYGILVASAMLIGISISAHVGKKTGQDPDLYWDSFVWIVISAIAGARIYYVIFMWEFYKDNLLQIFNLRAGGLAIYGGVLAGLLTAFIFAKIKKIPFLKIFDILAPCCWIGQIIGRWGNFMNIEAYGSTTTLPWRMCSPKIASELYFRKEMIDFETYEAILGGSVGVHPTFLYESLWNLAALIFVLCIFKKKKFDGQIFATYLIWYGFGRMLIEGLRTDSLMIGQFRVSQLIGLLSCVLGIALMIFWAIKSNKTAQTNEENYTPVFEAAVSGEEEVVAESDTPLENDNTDTSENKGE